MSDSMGGVQLRPRFCRERLEETLEDTPITILQGARQVGKSTLARDVLASRGASLISLDGTAAYQAAKADPETFVRQSRGLLGIDEVQRVPELVLAMKDAVDGDRRPGRFLVTGSANLLSIRGTLESLAGRAETVVLYGLSRGEIEGSREDFIDRVFSGDPAQAHHQSTTYSREDYLDIFCRGSYPEPLGRGEGRRRAAWFDNYLRRIISRDARDLSRLLHLDRLTDLLRLLSANNSGEFVKARLARDSGIPETSIGAYVELLETLYLVHRIPAWGNRLTARVTGRPKVALLDSGLAARLNNVTPAAMKPGAVADAAGGLFEAFVGGELRRQLTWSVTEASLFHFRDTDGLEVDLVLEANDRSVVGIEVKAARSVAKKDFRGLEFLRDRLGHRFMCGVVLHSGPQALPFGDRLWALPVSAMWS